MNTALMQQASPGKRHGSMTVKPVCLWATRAVPEST